MFFTLNKTEETDIQISLTVSDNVSSTCPHNMVNFGPLTAEIGWRVWDTQQISTDFAFWLRYFHGLISIQQRAPRTFGWAAITLGIGPHSSFVFEVL